VTENDTADLPHATWSTVTTLKTGRLRSSREETQNTAGSVPVRLADRMTFKNQAFDIKVVEEIGRRKSLEIRVLARGA